MKNRKVAFIGIDGAGKTTIIRKVKKNLEGRGKSCRVFYMGLGRDFRIPFFKQLISLYSKLRYESFGNKKMENRIGVKAGRDNYRQRSFLWLLVQYTEFWLRYLKASSEKTDYALFDRYFYDGLVFAGDRSFNFLRRFTPKPDICFLIYAPAETIMKRKKEANKENISDFYEKTRKISRYFKIIEINNTKKLKTVVDEILMEIDNIK